ncbi:uncharacterized protein CBL_09600 [Carabus blaptoides fortunei]
MSHFIIIREYRQNDQFAVRDIVKQSLTSLVTDTFISTLTKEITFQLMVVTAAVMFIFLGMPITYCIAAIPIVIIGIYLCVYTSHVFKSMELFQERPSQCWVAEACEPFFSFQSPEKLSYRILTEYEIADKDIDVGSLQRKVVGTVALKKHKFAENSSWLYRLAVEHRYARKGIASALIRSAVKWSRIRGYDTTELSITENQESARELFTSVGFQLRQMYHKQIIGSALTLLKYQFGFDLAPNL